MPLFFFLTLFDLELLLEIELLSLVMHISFEVCLLLLLSISISIGSEIKPRFMLLLYFALLLEVFALFLSFF